MFSQLLEFAQLHSVTGHCGKCREPRVKQSDPCKGLKSRIYVFIGKEDAQGLEPQTVSFGVFVKAYHLTNNSFYN